MQIEAERRQHFRKTSSIAEAVVYPGKTGYGGVKVRILDISLDGISFETESETLLSEGKNLEMNIFPFATKFGLIKKWIKSNDTLCTIGAQFTSLTYLNQKTLYSIVNL